MALTTWFWVGAVGMLAGTVLPIRDCIRHPSHRRYDLVLAGITGLAAIAYLTMGLGITATTVGDRTVYLARYIDWLVTTPLIVLYLAMLARPGRRTSAWLLAADVFVIAAGIAAALTTGVQRWLFFAVGAAGYAALLYGLLGTLPRALGDDPRVRSLFVTLRNITVVLWTLYPVVWLLSPAGIGILQTEMYTIVVVYLDFISKVAFVAFAVLGADAVSRLVAADAAAPATTEPTPDGD
ncbi:bacteriorhodopsin [Halobacterium salinarum]|uniref:sensory rhodopsin II n=1 Tax=Halobacterium salinarum TaxID=2242 RepID=UPI001F42C534|nr:sensory rhodopsin II [Halobacterium salinarum]MCF2206774.1 bacteriorhodopsin [Halobacterium salinarum]MCF2241314.1 bacteriorhodopsin [Halobacterium salinarum]